MTMNYVSTRGFKTPKKFSEILLEGLAPDGGLYMPEYYPQVTEKDLVELRKLSYPELALWLISKFVGEDDIPNEDLRKMIFKTYTKEKFGTEGITPLKIIHKGVPKVYLQGLSNGPTLAFKDIALQLLGNLFEYELARKGKELNILGATSGDTGSAAINAMKGKKGIRVFMLSPNGRMSKFQQAQMYSIKDPNIFNIAIDGVFDDCQDIVKDVSNDQEFKAMYSIGTVNSINWARILSQVVYFFYGYLQITENSNEKINFVVPTGNFGNICAGHIARMMGLPIEHLILATNENNILEEFFTSGSYLTIREVYPTSSPSMDISKASNFERFIFDLLDRDPSRVNSLFNNPGGFALDEKEFSKIKKFGFLAGKSDHSKRMKTIKHIWEDCKIVLDTHTADAAYVASTFEHNLSSKIIILETAKAAKFEDSIVEAIGIKPPRPESFEGIEDLKMYFNFMRNSSSSIKRFIEKKCN